MRQEEADGSAASVVGFCRYIRTNGLPVGLQQTLAALEAVKAVGISDRQAFSDGLRAALCSSKAEWDLFESLFVAFWSDSRTETANTENTAKAPTAKPTASSLLLTGKPSEGQSRDAEGKMVLGASAQKRLKTVDFSEVPQNDLARLEEISMRLLRQLSQRLSRRLRIRNLGDRVDVRRTIRRNVTRGGDPIALAYKGRKPQKNRLVIFLDISGSMNLYSLFLVRFAYALQKHCRGVHTFLFSTSVFEITGVLRAARLSGAMQALSQTTADWSGGTKIGGSLGEFNRRHARKLLARDTVFMILSDGWDTGEPEVLAAELGACRRRVRKLIWLNPLLGLKDYQPVTRGMSAALPHVDVFASAHNLQSLLALEKYL
jgi:uncharacterized protein